MILKMSSMERLTRRTYNKYDNFVDSKISLSGGSKISLGPFNILPHYNYNRPFVNLSHLRINKLSSIDSYNIELSCMANDGLGKGLIHTFEETDQLDIYRHYGCKPLSKI